MFLISALQKGLFLFLATEILFSQNIEKTKWKPDFETTFFRAFVPEGFSEKLGFERNYIQKITSWLILLLKNVICFHFSRLLLSSKKTLQELFFENKFQNQKFYLSDCESQFWHIVRIWIQNLATCQILNSNFLWNSMFNYKLLLLVALFTTDSSKPPWAITSYNIFAHLKLVFTVQTLAQVFVFTSILTFDFTMVSHFHLYNRNTWKKYLLLINFRK